MDVDADIGDPAVLFRDIDLSARRSVAVAVSGGGDSMALLDLLDRHLNSLPTPPQLTAVTVDHDLRPSSMAEAAWVHFFCELRGIRHTVVRWEGAKPQAGVQAAAREVRYRLLAAAAKAGGSDILLTGHTLDDQTETHVMRRARASQGAGLAGMAAATLFDRATWIVRPLLGVRRDTLRRHLSAHDIPWIDDPSNDDARYERVRVRRAARPDEGTAAEIRWAQAVRRRAARSAAHFIGEYASLEPGGAARVAIIRPTDADEAAVALALAALTAAIGGQRVAGTGRTAASLVAFYRAGTGEDGRMADVGHPARMTLGRCVFERDGDTLRLWREWRNLPQIVLGPAESAVWDGRYAFVNTESGTSFIVGPRRLSRRQDGRLAAGAEDAEPAVRSWGGEGLPRKAEPSADLQLHPPERHALRIDRYLAQYDHFLPEFDIVLADAIARLFGRTAFPEPPVHRTYSN